jgi:hypothetical protein
MPNQLPAPELSIKPMFARLVEELEGSNLTDREFILLHFGLFSGFQYFRELEVEMRLMSDEERGRSQANILRELTEFRDILRDAKRGK